MCAVSVARARLCAGEPARLAAACVRDGVGAAVVACADTASAPSLLAAGFLVYLADETEQVRANMLAEWSDAFQQGGLLKPGTYIVSADFGKGAKVADRFVLEAGQRVTVDCSLAARVCSAYTH